MWITMAHDQHFILFFAPKTFTYRYLTIFANINNTIKIPLPFNQGLNKWQGWLSDVGVGWWVFGVWIIQQYKANNDSRTNNDKVWLRWLIGCLPLQFFYMLFSVPRFVQFNLFHVISWAKYIQAHQVRFKSLITKERIHSQWIATKLRRCPPTKYEPVK